MLSNEEQVYLVLIFSWLIKYDNSYIIDFDILKYWYRDSNDKKKIVILDYLSKSHIYTNSNILFDCYTWITSIIQRDINKTSYCCMRKWRG